MLIRLFLLPGLILFPVTYLVLYQGSYEVFATAIFFCGLVTVAQFSYVSEYLPKVFPVHLRGTGSAFATNVGGRMLGTMAATLNTELLAPLFTGENPPKVATAAAIIGGTVYADRARAVVPAADTARRGERRVRESGQTNAWRRSPLPRCGDLLLPAGHPGLTSSPSISFNNSSTALSSSLPRTPLKRITPLASRT